MTFTKIKNLAYRSLKEYPTLYLRDTLEKSLLEIYDHFFFILGNGYYWLLSSKGLYYSQEPLGESVFDEEGEYVEFKHFDSVDYDENEIEVSDFDLKALHESLWQDYLEGKPPFELERSLDLSLKAMEANPKDFPKDSVIYRFQQRLILSSSKEKSLVFLYPVCDISFKDNYGGPFRDIHKLAPDWKEALFQLSEYAVNNPEAFNREDPTYDVSRSIALAQKINHVLKNGGSLND